MTKPKIVVLDDVEMSDKQKHELDSIGSVTWHDNNPSGAEEIVERLRGSTIAIVGWTQVDRDILARLPELKMISVWSTSYSHVDVVAARALGITVSNVPGYSSVAVAELTIGLVFALTRNIVLSNTAVRRGPAEWSDFPARELSAQTLGVVGLGNIGKEVARRATALGMRVISHSPTTSSATFDELGVQSATFVELLQQSDVTTLHIPSREENHGIIGDHEFSLMKPGAYFINTSDVELIDQDALIARLTSGHLAGVALDHSHSDERLLELDNAILTPDIGFYTAEALERLSEVCTTNVKSFSRGNPQHVVS